MLFVFDVNKELMLIFNSKKFPFLGEKSQKSNFTIIFKNSFSFSFFLQYLMFLMQILTIFLFKEVVIQLIR
jgi:hypothetical protein